MKKQDMWETFVARLVESVELALDHGTPAKFSIGGAHDITIEIYKTKEQMQQFDEQIKDALKKTGMG